MRALKKFWFTLVLFSVSLLITSCGGNTQSSKTNNSSGNSNGTSPGLTNTGGAGGPESNTGSATEFVYVGTSGLGTGAISGFAVAANGTAAQIAGSPFQGAGGSLVSNGHFVIGTDGTNIVSYSVGSNGALKQAATVNGVTHNDTPDGSAVGSMSMDRSGTSLYAGEINFQGTDNEAYGHFEVGSNGAVTWADNTGISADYSSNLTFSQGNQFAYGEGCYFLGFTLFGFSRGNNGTLSDISTNAVPPVVPENMDVCPGSSAASPKSDYLVAVMVPEGTPGSTSLLVTYKINPDGSLALLSNSTLNTSFTAISDIQFDLSGRYVAAATNAGVQVYTLSASGTLMAVGVPSVPTVNFNEVKWDDSSHLYAVSNTTNSFYIFNASNGTLTQASGSPYSVTNAGTMAVVPKS